MANTIVLKRSATPGKVPTTSQLSLGEIAINTYDGLIYIKKDDGTPSVVQIGGVTSVNGETGSVTIDTGDVAENGNLYFTQARARAAVSATGSLSYNASTGVFSYSTPSTISSLSNHTTDNLTEGTTNKYYADSLARSAISVTAGAYAYNASTGVISIPNNTNQLTNGANFATQSYVNSAVSAISTSSIEQGNSNITVTDTGTGTVTVTVDGSTALTVDSTGVTVAGNFTVSGTQTVVNSNTISLADNIITLNSDATGAPTQNAGIEVERGDDVNTQIRWNEGTDKWTFTNDGSVYYPIAVGTDDLAEGSTNLYHTTARARGAISASSGTGVAYNSTTGAISLSGIPNSSLANSSVTINGTAVSLGGTRTLDSDAIGEGTTNLYFTNARARGAVSAGTGISYNSTTGAISTSAIPNASLTNSKVTIGTTDVSLGGAVTTFAGLTSVTSTAFVGALTGNADTATSAGKWTTARTITLGGDLTGSTSIDGSANVTLNATITANSIALGTDTTGNYMVDLTAGTGISISHTQGEGSTATVTNTDLGSSQNIFKNFTDGTTTAAADSNNDTFKFRGSAGVTVAVASDDATHGDSLLVSLSAVPNSSLANSTISGVSLGSNLATLGMGVSGTGLSGSASYNGSGAATFTVTSNATSANTANAIVSRGASGEVAVGALTVTGAITATGEVTAYYSDLRLKTNIVPIADALDKVEAINGVTFDPNEDALALGIDDRHQMGVIAQEIEAVAPELVCDSAFAGYKTVRYDKLTALLIEAVKELSAKVKTLEAQLGNTKPQL